MKLEIEVSISRDLSRILYSLADALSGKISSEDQNLLDSILAREAYIARRLKALDAQTSN